MKLLARNDFQLPPALTGFLATLDIAMILASMPAWTLHACGRAGAEGAILIDAILMAVFTLGFIVWGPWLIFGAMAAGIPQLCSARFWFVVTALAAVFAFVSFAAIPDISPITMPASCRIEL
jgi:hypothetical protein